MGKKLSKEKVFDVKTEGIKMGISPNTIFTGMVTIGVAVLVLLLTKSFAATDRLSKVEEKASRIENDIAKIGTKIDKLDSKIDIKIDRLDSKIDGLKDIILQKKVNN